MGVDDEVRKIQEKNPSNFVKWIPDNVKTSVCDVPHKDKSMSATFIGNSTAIQGIFERVQRRFLRLYSRDAFLDWYLGEGMERSEFEDANTNLGDLIEEYNQYQEATEYHEVLDHENEPYKLAPLKPIDETEEAKTEEAETEETGT